jgi:hypothetical protein
MARTLRLAILIGVLAALVIGTGTVLAGPGPGDPHGKLVDTSLAGLPASFVGKLLAGVTGAGHPWDIKDGHATLDRNGHLDLHVHGLVLSHTDGGPATEGTNPVPSGRAIVSCNGGVGEGNTVMSDVVPFSVPNGDAHVNQRLTLPSSCLAPTIFFGSASGAWFAVSG